MHRVNTLAEFVQALKDKHYGPKIVAYVKTSQNEDLVKFLTTMSAGRKTANEYNVFIKRGGREELNLLGELRGRFDAVAAQPTPNWAAAPWAEAIQSVLGDFNENVVPHIPDPVTATAKDLADWSRKMQDKDLGPRIIAQARAGHSEEILKFLTSMRAGKKGLNEYTVYIKAGAREEINIDASLRKQFDAIAKLPKPDWSKAPWDKAVREVLDLYNNNVGMKVT